MKHDIQFTGAQVKDVESALFKHIPMTVREISDCTGIPHLPTVRRILRELNFLGVPVVSDTRGFHLAQDAEELEEYAGELRSRADAIRARASQVTALCHQMRAQEALRASA